MCKQIKLVEHFEKSDRYRSGYRSQCVQCRYLQQKETRLAYHLKNKYSMSLEDYLSRIEQQNGVCAICKLPETRVVKSNSKKYSLDVAPRLAVDHNHETGSNRGLLCTKCNIAIGHFQDNIENLKSAIKYLEMWKEK